jgi:hypothetical protein
MAIYQLLLLTRHMASGRGCRRGHATLPARRYAALPTRRYGTTTVRQ